VKLRYIDEAGVERFKRRYVWAFWAYLAGVVTTLLLEAIFR